MLWPLTASVGAARPPHSTFFRKRETSAVWPDAARIVGPAAQNGTGGGGEVLLVSEHQKLGIYVVCQFEGTIETPMPDVIPAFDDARPVPRPIRRSDRAVSRHTSHPMLQFRDTLFTYRLFRRDD